MGLGGSARKAEYYLGTVNPAALVSARILIVMAAQWPRALLRAELREAGYDAMGARNLDEAGTHPREEAGRGPVRLIILDQAAIPSSHDPRLTALLHTHPEAQTVLLAGAFQPPLPGKWGQVLRHPTTIAEIIQTAQQLLPRPPATRSVD
jgi:hypothetical protein